MADPQSVLDPLAAPREVKAAAWDAFQSAADQQDFQKRLDSLQIPRETKAQLWDIKYGGGTQQTPTPPQPEAESWLKSIFLAPARGLTEDIPAGFNQMMQPGIDAKLGGASRMFHGATKTAAPFMLPEAIVAAPGLALTSLATGAAGGALAQGGADFFGAPEGTASAIGDVGSIIGGGLPYAGKVTGITPRVGAGVKEAASQFKSELPQIGKWEAAATPAGAVLGYIAGEPQLGTGLGVATGAARALPPIFRGFRRGFSSYEPPPTLSGAPPPMGGPSARFVPGQYDAPASQRSPVEVGGAHIPDYHGPIIPPEMPPSPLDMPTSAPATPAPPNVADIYKATAKNMGFKNFEDMPANVQEFVKAQVAKQPAYSTTTPENISVIPEGEHNIIRKVAEANRANKDMTIARSLKDRNITQEMLDNMPDADLRAIVKELGYTPSYGKNYSRTWPAFRRDLRQLLDPGSKLTPPPMPPK